MRWWTHLYTGDRASRRGGALLQKIAEEKFLPDTYVITPAVYGHHLLDIRPAGLLTGAEKADPDFLVLGVACGYGEAKEVVRRMVEDMYRDTGGFDWNAYMASLDGDGGDTGRQMGE